MSRREQAATALLRRAAAMGAVEGGATSRYFESQWHWEEPMRRQFLAVRRAVRGGAPMGRADALRALDELNRRYNTRFPRRDLAALADALVAAIEGEAWWATRPLPELGSAHFKSGDATSLVPKLLRAPIGSQRPYSLVTKFLHFLLPRSFAIYDAQAAASIQMWSYFALDTSGAWRFEFSRIAETSGSGYGRVIEFYQGVAIAEDGRLHAELAAVADAMEHRLGVAECDRGEFVSPLDVIDKLLWSASGNPLVLGLARPLDAGDATTP